MPTKPSQYPISDTPSSIAIIGGGIAGLSTAYFLQRQAAESGQPVSVTLLEAEPRLGGKMLTEHIDGFTVEGGPDSFITQKPAALQLVEELGIEDRLIATQDENKGVYVYQGGRLKPLPDGVMLIVPTEIMPFALSSLFSPLGKLRMGMDLFLPGRQDDEDETLADFIRRRLGHEALDRLAEPLMAGIYNAEAEDQSIMATFPRFRAIEKKHGSLIKGMLAGKRNRPQPAPQNGSRPRSVFMSMRGGISDLAEALTAHLNGNVRLGTPVQAIEANGSGYRLRLPDGESLHADQVVLATPAYAAADLLQGLRSDLAGCLRRIRYVSTGTISLAYKRSDIPHPLNGFGLVIPRSAGRRINAVTWSSIKWPYRAPDGKVLLRVFFGGSRHPDVFALPDDELAALVHEELRVIMGITAKPEFQRIYRWANASPQYDVGHLDRVAGMRASCPPGIHLTGSAYGGVGIPDCVAQGKETARRVAGRVGLLVG
ncbi:MAG: protoporphyrinogen oxidase [Caldilineales bacterium]|nr:protoporphyrinogen oxidase [Caldilineales bacterium]